MADNTNSIDIAVQDGVSPEIAPKLIQIADASDRAGQAVGSLKAQLASLSASGISGLSSLLVSLQSGTVSAANAQGTLTSQLRANGSAISENAAARRLQASASVESVRASQAEVAATREKQMADIQATAAGTMRARLEEEMSALFIEGAGATDAQTAATQNLIGATSALSEQNEFLTAAYGQLAEATLTLREAKQSLAATLKEISAGNIAEGESSSVLAGALQGEAEATEQLQLAKTNLAEVQSYLTQITAGATVSLIANTEASEANTVAAINQGEAYATARITGGALTGSINMMMFGFARLASSMPVVAAALKAAFPLVIAGAMIAVVYQLGEAVVKYVDKVIGAAYTIATAFNDANDQLRKSSDELALNNDKLDQTIARLEHGATTNGLAMALDQARVEADKLDDSLDRVQKQVSTVLKQNEISWYGGLMTGQGSTSETSRFVSTQFNSMFAARDNMQKILDSAQGSKDPKAAQAALTEGYKQERTAIEGVISALQTEYNAKEKIQNSATPEQRQWGISGVTIAPDQTANLTILGEAAHMAQAELRNLDLTMANMTKSSAADKLRDQVSSTSVANKEAAKEWKALTAAFVEYQTAVEKTGHKPTAQENLSWLQGHESTINPLNAPKLASKELPYRNDINAQSQFKADETDKLQDQISDIGNYSNALREAAMLNGVLEQARRRNIDLSPQEIAAYKAQIAQIVESREYTKKLGDIYDATAGAAQTFSGRMDALHTLYERGQISEENYMQGIASSMKQYTEATSAVVKFTNALKIQQEQQAAHTGTTRQIAVQDSLQGLDERLRQPGADASHPFGYNEQEIKQVNATLSPLIEQMQNFNAVQQETNKLLNQQSDLEDQLATKQLARASAMKEGSMSQTAGRSGALQDWSQRNNQQLSSGTGGNPFEGAIAQYANQFTTVAQGIQNAFAPVFKTLADGFADSLGRAIVYGKNLGQALKSVAKEGIAELISGLIKVGLQYAINATMGSIALAAMTAAAAAQGAAIAGAWAPAAAMVSLATMGANAGPATAAIAGTTALADSMSLMRFADGGYVSGPGTGLSDSILGRLSNGEFVVNAASTAQNRGLLEDINSGHSAYAPQTFAHSASHVQMRTQVEVHNYGSRSNIEVQQMDEHRVRLIVRDEAPRVMQQHTDGLVATTIANPNSKTSKAIARNTTAARNR